MATDKLINQTQGSQLINGLTAIASEIASINTNAVRPNSTSATENDIMVYGSNAYTAKDSGVSIETAQITGSADTKLPTSKNIKTNVAGTAVLTNYPSTTPTSIQSVESTDTITQAIKKVEDNTRINNTNILSNEADINQSWNKCKNLLDLSKATSVTNPAPASIGYTVNADKSITITVTSLSSASTLVFSGLPYISGTLVNSGCPSGGGTSTYMTYVAQSDQITDSIDIGEGSNAFTMANSTFDYKIRLGTGSRVFTIYPMICSQADWNASHTYFPYALSNVELTEEVTSQEAGFINSTGSATTLTIEGLNTSDNPNCLLMCTDLRDTDAKDSLLFITRYLTNARINKVYGDITPPTISISGDVITLSGMRTYQKITAIAHKHVTLST